MRDARSDRHRPRQPTLREAIAASALQRQKLAFRSKAPDRYPLGRNQVGIDAEAHRRRRKWPQPGGQHAVEPDVAVHQQADGLLAQRNGERRRCCSARSRNEI